MPVLHSGYTVAYASEKREEEKLFGNCIHYLFALCKFILRKMLPNLIQEECPLTGKRTASKDTVDYTCSITENSTTCGESSDELTLDGSSKCSSIGDERDEIISRGYNFDGLYIKSNFPVTSVDIPYVQKKEGRKHKTKSRAAIMIQDILHQRFRLEKTRRQLENELRASQIVMNTWRIWSKEEKERKKVNAAKVVQNAWRSWTTVEKQGREAANKIVAIVTIQVKWRNYLARVQLRKHFANLARRKALKEDRAKLARCKMLEAEFLTFFS